MHALGYPPGFRSVYAAANALSPSWRAAAFDELDAMLLHDLLELRQDVFVVEQACAYADMDGLDATGWHLWSELGREVVACLRALPPGALHDDIALGRVAVRKALRRRGLGRELMRRGIEGALRRYGDHAIRLHAQSYLEAFYGSLRFEIVGPELLDDGIPHLPMRLAAASER